MSALINTQESYLGKRNNLLLEKHFSSLREKRNFIRVNKKKAEYKKLFSLFSGLF